TASIASRPCSNLSPEPAMRQAPPRIVLVTRQSRLRQLLSAWGTKGQVGFRYRSAKVASLAKQGKMDLAMAAQQVEEDADFMELDDEDAVYRESVSTLQRELDLGMPVQVVDRSLVHTIDFSLCSCVVVAGPDGLVANTAKYACGIPIVGVNPDPGRIDGVLLPFRVHEARNAVSRVLNQRAVIRTVTLAQAQLDDGQRLLAFNDFFIGVASHTSARYELAIESRDGRRSEAQISSGVLVSTGAGSTGWMSSVFNMAIGLTQAMGSSGAAPALRAETLPWEARELLWAVREPFRSQASGVELVAGKLREGERMTLESQMSSGGVIFSDGMEQDFRRFDGGAIVDIGIAPESAKLVVQHAAAST
ncbi:MAG: NAD(+)/NADH kinase, partial [Planctomycetales bacterium]|nr:NAD(+)/NADH kinase [Planctomycetales bacterium]